jgi:hypothetical protein
MTGVSHPPKVGLKARNLAKLIINRLNPRELQILRDYIGYKFLRGPEYLYESLAQKLEEL